MIPNRPTPEGRELGAQLARFTVAELEKQRAEFPGTRDPCGTCAFRAGTVPNGCAATVMDALKCVLEHRDFHCHETPGSRGLCAGWMVLLCAAPELPPVEAPWPFSLSAEDEAELSAREKK